MTNDFLLGLAANLHIAKQAGMISTGLSSLGSVLPRAGKAAPEALDVGGQALLRVLRGEAPEAALTAVRGSAHAPAAFVPQAAGAGEPWLARTWKKQLGGFGFKRYAPYLSHGEWQGAVRPQMTVPEVLKGYLTSPIKTFKAGAKSMSPLDVGFLGLSTAMAVPEMMDPQRRGEGLGRTLGMIGGWVGVPHHMPILPQLALWQLAETVGSRIGRAVDRKRAAEAAGEMMAPPMGM